MNTKRASYGYILWLILMLALVIDLYVVKDFNQIFMKVCFIGEITAIGFTLCFVLYVLYIHHFRLTIRAMSWINAVTICAAACYFPVLAIGVIELAQGRGVPLWLFIAGSFGNASLFVSSLAYFITAKIGEE